MWPTRSTEWDLPEVLKERLVQVRGRYSSDEFEETV